MLIPKHPFGPLLLSIFRPLETSKFGRLLLMSDCDYAAEDYREFTRLIRLEIPGERLVTPIQGTMSMWTVSLSREINLRVMTVHLLVVAVVMFTTIATSTSAHDSL